MDELFSCRNCIHNSGQSLNAGRGPGFCLRHESVIQRPAETTCKYLHRKDLPHFLIDEGIREHAAEFALFSDLVSLESKEPIPKMNYSERFAWEHRAFNPLLHTLAQYHKTKPAWVFIQSFSGGMDGLRSLVHAALIRRYLDRCNSWRSSYRLFLGLIQEIDTEPRFDPRAILVEKGDDPLEVQVEALWDVVFARISGIQEYGQHAHLEELMWATDSLNGNLAELNWSRLQGELGSARARWTDLIIEHAKKEGAFFPPPDPERAEELPP